MVQFALRKLRYIKNYFIFIFVFIYFHLELRKTIFGNEKSLIIHKSHGGAIIYGVSRAVKIDSRDKIKKMHRNWRAIVNGYPSLKTVFVDCELYEDPFLAAIIMERGFPIPGECIESAALEIYRRIKFEAPPRRCNDVVHRTFIKVGIEIVIELFGNDFKDNFFEELEQYFQKIYSLGLVHGDFHDRNMVSNERGDVYRAIDLDCISFHGIQEFDALYFIIESYSRRKEISWIMAINHFINNTIDDHHINLLQSFGVDRNLKFFIGFFLNRIGQDYKLNNFKYYKSELTPVVSLMRSNVG